MRILGIESSCDETAAAVVEDGRRILASVVASQDDIHRPYGGVVPELASRNHSLAIVRVVERALEESGTDLKNIDGIAVTRGPGLIGSLLVGLSFAKALSYSRGIPYVGVHHIEGHLAAAMLGESDPTYPLVGLVASGGHTSLYRMPSRNRFELIGQTRDDAAGEAFDKVSILCGLGFPGGPAIDRTSENGDPQAIDFPRPHPASLDFSFSGLKTAVAKWIQKNGVPKDQGLADLVASFQEAVVDVLLAKLFEAAETCSVHDVVVCGGVARNRRLRSRLEEEISRRDFKLWLAKPELCTDNAAMIAAAGFARLKDGDFDDLALNAQATIPLAAS